MQKTLFCIAFIFSGLASLAQSDVQMVEETVSRSAIEGHIYFLADDLLKGRQTGTPELKIAATYLATQLRSYGVMPDPATGSYFQAMPMERKYPPATLTTMLNGQSLNEVVAMAQGNVDFTGEMVYVGHGLKADYANVDVKGKVVVVKAGSPDASTAQAAFGLMKDKIEIATSQGAIGVVELLDAGDQIWGFIDHQFNEPRVAMAGDDSADSIPFVWVKDTGFTIANSMQANAMVKGQLTMTKKEGEKLDSYNVVGWVEGSDPKLKDEFIIYSGHYDHVGIGTPDASGDTIYNGARDNAVGVTTVLSMAENLAKYPTKRSALFILFTGEEMGLLGSRYYVENPILPLDKMVYCFNSDNAGYNDTSLATIIGLPRTTAAEHIKNACKQFGLTAVDDPAPEQGLFDRSDNVNFARAGIPAPTFSLGFTAFNGDVTKYYHRPGDEADSIDYDYMEKFFKSYVMAGRLIGNDPVTPTWTAGDKYEEASKELYGN
ncbi:M28 family peptidase [Gilvibacter sediminis]|uniref:M28 family peptidase n=1 Tax=Gilvibacter sediminis TaxID=379071 RepID=UPI0023505406|nr:M28 family peptidase [Gilvibacter sediminis]MDC7998490.1 M28 family peptidase [Gilvibacter sediminis]